MNFIHPFTLLSVSSSGGGKTFWIKKLLEANMITPKPQKFLYLYGEFQPIFKEMKGVVFQEGIPEGLYESFTPDVRTLLIIDDLMESPRAQDLLVRIFTMGSHHRSLSCINLQQVLFPRNPKFRTISLNANYILLFKSVRDRTQVVRLASQMQLTRALTQAYTNATHVKFGYLLIDLRSDCDEKLRLRTQIFSKDGPTIVYVPKK